MGLLSKEKPPEKLVNIVIRVAPSFIKKFDATVAKKGLTRSKAIRILMEKEVAP